MTFLPLLLILSLGLVHADRVLIHSPEKQATFTPGASMAIDYAVRFEGMAKLASTSVSIHYANHTVVTFLPAASWTDTPTGQRGANATWTVPSDLPEGKYLLRIAGPATYLCSSKGNGQAPYERCHMTIHKTRHFRVGDQQDAEDQDLEEQLQEQVEQLENLQEQAQQIQEEQAQQIEQAQQTQEEQEQQIQDNDTALDQAPAE
ncbi:hypothetical protein [Absidia glauca]|uniref:Uncharacterized protein n=1 Tax=Absidia glauca TaxID=4829 RepID=A0A168PBY8_ABSGL|nr:hypothetical protein [Absidia glauca]